MKPSPSTEARAALRVAIRAKVKALGITNNAAAERLGLTVAQTSRLLNDYDAFSLDRLVDAARSIKIPVRISA